MDIFCQDTKLNLSPYYLKPGFRLRRLVPAEGRARAPYKREEPRRQPADPQRDPAEQRACRSSAALELVIDQPGKKVGVLGFSFKAGTDDLRESPMVELIERLIGKGYELRVFDRNVQPRQPGRAPTATTSLNHIPHIARLMVRVHRRGARRTPTRS